MNGSILIIALITVCVFALYCAPIQSTRSDYLMYISLEGDDAIVGYRVSAETGDLTEVERFSIPGRIGALTVEPAHQYLYAALRKTKQLATLKIKGQCRKRNGRQLSLAPKGTFQPADSVSDSNDLQRCSDPPSA